METKRTATYLALITRALALPRQYRTGIEIRARRLWKTMTPAEQAYLARLWS